MADRFDNAVSLGRLQASTTAFACVMIFVLTAIAAAPPALAQRCGTSSTPDCNRPRYAPPPPPPPPVHRTPPISPSLGYVQRNLLPNTRPAQRPIGNGNNEMPPSSPSGGPVYRGDPNNPWRADCLRQNPDNDPALDDIEACQQADIWDNGPRATPPSYSATPAARPSQDSRGQRQSDPPDDPPVSTARLQLLGEKLSAVGVGAAQIAACLRSIPRAARCMLESAGIPPDDGIACLNDYWPAPCMTALIQQYGKAGEKILADDPKW